MSMIEFVQNYEVLSADMGLQARRIQALSELREATHAAHSVRQVWHSARAWNEVLRRMRGTARLRRCRADSPQLVGLP